ncbi:MAG: hypothetical protein KatS3mg061_1619 [Dehalococcoidia bacterium]|nr:MAG: hypothetical protein KatS3mg061_1619 [Dehalococcoidia bacterium]
MERPLPQVATLTVLSDQAGLAREFVLRPGEYLIGRLPECEIALPHPTVSGRHARLRLTEGQVLIEDLGSTNGTAVNQRANPWPSPPALRRHHPGRGGAPPVQRRGQHHARPAGWTGACQRAGDQLLGRAGYLRGGRAGLLGTASNGCPR